MMTAKQIFKQMSDAERYKVMDYLNDNPTSKRIFRKDFTKSFWDDLKKRKNGNIQNHIILFCWGETGSYKSGVMIEIGRFMDENFSNKKIAFTNNELLSIVEKSKPKTFIQRDEIVSEFGIGSGRERAFIQAQAETLRANEISFGYISPKPRPFGTEHYILHCIGHNDFELDDEGMATEPVYVLVGVMNPITNNYLGGLVIEIEWMNEVWKKYLKRKIAFLKSVRERHFSKMDWEKLAKKVLSAPESIYAKTKYEWFIVFQKVAPDLTTEEMKMLYAQIKMLKKREE